MSAARRALLDGLLIGFLTICGYAALVLIAPALGWTWVR